MRFCFCIQNINQLLNSYINLNLPLEELAKKSYFIEVEKKKIEAVLHKKPLHDPENKILKN